MAEVAKTRIQADAYYQLPDYQDNTLIQLIDGEVVIGMAPNVKHQKIVREIMFLFMTIAKQQQGEAFDSPIEVYLDEYNIYEPDVVYLIPNSNCAITEKHLRGAPDLVVEVLSPSTAKHDRSTKFQAYQQHGVDEYWIVDPVHETIEVWQQANNRFNLLNAFSSGDTFTSRPLGEDVAVSDLLDSNN